MQPYIYKDLSVDYYTFPDFITISSKEGFAYFFSVIPGLTRNPGSVLISVQKAFPFQLCLLSFPIFALASEPAALCQTE